MRATTGATSGGAVGLAQLPLCPPASPALPSMHTTPIGHVPRGCLARVPPHTVTTGGSPPPPPPAPSCHSGKWFPVWHPSFSAPPLGAVMWPQRTAAATPAAAAAAASAEAAAAARSGRRWQRRHEECRRGHRHDGGGDGDGGDGNGGGSGSRHACRGAGRCAGRPPPNLLPHPCAGGNVIVWQPLAARGWRHRWCFGRERASCIDDSAGGGFGWVRKALGGARWSARLVEGGQAGAANAATKTHASVAIETARPPDASPLPRSPPREWNRRRPARRRPPPPAARQTPRGTMTATSAAAAPAAVAAAAAAAMATASTVGVAQRHKRRVEAPNGRGASGRAGDPCRWRRG